MGGVSFKHYWPVSVYAKKGLAEFNRHVAHVNQVQGTVLHKAYQYDTAQLDIM